MNTDNEASASNVPEPLPAATPKITTLREIPQKREPFIRLSFFLWAPLFIFVSGLLVYFFYPDALNQMVAVAYKEYLKYAPAAAEAPTPRVVAVVDTPAPQAPPSQTYSMQEIKEGIQEHLLNFGMVDKGTAFDWRKLEYIDPTDLNYQLYAHLARGSTELCMGTVVLDQQEHKMIITSQLQGW